MDIINTPTGFYYSGTDDVGPTFEEMTAEVVQIPDNPAPVAESSSFLSSDYWRGKIAEFQATMNAADTVYGATQAALFTDGAIQSQEVWDGLMQSLAEYDSKKTLIRTTAEAINLGVQAVNAMGGKSKNGRNSVWWLDSPDDYLGQSPLLSASVFNFFSPFYSRPGAIAQAGLVAPEFQNASDTQVVGSTNFFSRMISDGGIGFDDTNRIDFDTTPWLAAASSTTGLLERMNWLLFSGGMANSTRTVLEKAISAVPANRPSDRLLVALNIAVVAPEFVVQR